MSFDWDKTCLVCGAETENRCSSCAEAGIDLRFCSSDHQALVWKAHRRVCGPGKANPFTWPLLSRSESAELVEHMHETTGTLITADPGRKTVASACAVILEDRAKSAIRGVTVGGPNHWLPAEDQQRVLLVVRAHEHLRLADAGNPLRRRTMTPSGILNELANHDLNIARDEPF
ncbi:hypothetical protein JCM8208_002840 [Rhodotorula glutinis]